MRSDQEHQPVVGGIRACRDEDRREMLYIINAAARAYRGVIPAARYHEPYMSDGELVTEIAAGVVFSGYDADGLVGVMGVQARADVDLIRHAYVLPTYQGRGVGSALLRQLCYGRKRPVLVGTWRAADWAIRFYERHGFARAPEAEVAPLLRTYWTVPEEQIETSVVLSVPALKPGGPSA